MTYKELRAMRKDSKFEAFRKKGNIHAGEHNDSGKLAKFDGTYEVAYFGEKARNYIETFAHYE